ncbi:MAG TPA: ATP-binding cassette domain-containing protein [Bacillota bacterium]|nr:ATP-binding cassette domain-containing protein [Bacillota bacterium]
MSRDLTKEEPNRDFHGEPVIEAAALVKKFDDFTAVRGVDFQVRQGECFGLLGPNGAGKTSTVRMIAGFSPVTGGKLSVFGLDIAKKVREIKARMGVVPQEDNLDPELSVLNNLLIYASYFRMDKELALKRAREVLEFMELTEKADTEVDSLSGGLKRRLTMGRALLNRPELLLLDEPTTGLDPYARPLLWQRLRRLKESGTTLLLTTHYLEEASQLCDRLVILHRGEILEQGTPQGLIDEHLGKDALELGLSNPEHYGAVLEAGSGLVKNHLNLGGAQVFFTNEGEGLSGLVSARAHELGITINYRRIRASNLEDVFLKLTGQSFGEADAPGEDSWGSGW